jgi:hypothetical protein
MTVKHKNDAPLLNHTYPQQAVFGAWASFAVLQPHPASPSAFFCSSSLQQASSFVVGLPPQHPAAATGIASGLLVIVIFSSRAIISFFIFI